MGPQTDIYISLKNYLKINLWINNSYTCIYIYIYIYI